MAHEITHWRQPNCSLSLQVSRLSNREPFSREINKTYGEGGGLNADYTMTEALAKAANLLGLNNLEYGVAFVFKTGGSDGILLDFADQKTKKFAKKILQKFIG